MTSCVWIIAGSDNSGEAGIQADLKTLQDFNVRACTIVTAITAQNRHAVQEVYYVPQRILKQQIHSLLEHSPAQIIKLGMQGRLQPISDLLQHFSGKVVCDPVIKSSSGYPLLLDIDFFVKKIFPHVDLLTPNVMEAEQLTKMKINSYADFPRVTQKLLQLGVKSVYLKGGHFSDPEFSQDYFSDGTESFWLSHKRIKNRNIRGTGCTLASAIAAALSLQYSLKDALVIAKMYLQQEIVLSIDGYMKRSGFPTNGDYFPYLTEKPLNEQPLPFINCGPTPLGIYPVVDSSQWILRLAKAGVSTIQLRIKEGNSSTIQQEIKSAVQISREYQCRLFINDYWKWAIQYGAYGVHLGQEDIFHADFSALHKANLRLGLSSHCFYEVARAHALRPSYLACGPIFSTSSKIMPFSPQGLERLRYWQQLSLYPLVAIGGINLDNMSSVVDSGVNGIAMISAITSAKNPIAVINQLHERSYA